MRRNCNARFLSDLSIFAKFDFLILTSRWAAGRLLLQESPTMRHAPRRRQARRNFPASATIVFPSSIETV